VTDPPFSVPLMMFPLRGPPLLGVASVHWTLSPSNVPSNVLPLPVIWSVALPLQVSVSPVDVMAWPFVRK
jgi:hypothetical protein